MNFVPPSQYFLSPSGSVSSTALEDSHPIPAPVVGTSAGGAGNSNQVQREETGSGFFARLSQSVRKMVLKAKSPVTTSLSTSAVQKKITTFHELFDEKKLESLVVDPRKMHFTTEVDGLVFVDVGAFGAIEIPPMNTETIISRCFVDPEVSYQDEAIPIADVDPSFKNLQDEVSQQPKDSQWVGGSYVNNYPRNKPEEGESDIRINCDAYWIGAFPLSNCSISIVADGCGPGIHSRNAAQITIAETKEYILKALAQENNLEGLTQIILDSFRKVHSQLIAHPDRMDRLTTINICIVFTAKSGERYLLVVGLGDTKCYLSINQSERDSVVLDLSQNMRNNFSRSSPGGILGGYERDEIRRFTIPLLLNLSVLCCRLPNERDSIIFNMTDGVSDNLNPYILGLAPKDADKRMELVDPDWAHLKPDLRREINTNFETARFAAIIAEESLSPGSNLDSICERITEYCSTITEPARTYFEAHPGTFSCVNLNKKEYPGKLDHTTIVALRSFGVSSPASSPTPIFSSSIGTSSSLT